MQIETTFSFRFAPVRKKRINNSSNSSSAQGYSPQDPCKMGVGSGVKAGKHILLQNWGRKWGLELEGIEREQNACE